MSHITELLEISLNKRTLNLFGFISHLTSPEHFLNPAHLDIINITNQCDTLWNSEMVKIPSN